MRYVRDNAWLAVHSTIVMRNMEANNTQRKASTQLAVNYPSYTMVIRQHWYIKAINDVCNAIFDQKGKKYDWFH